MGVRVDSVSVSMDVYVEFEGHSTVRFSYTPAPDDPLVAALVAKNEELLRVELASAVPAEGLLG